MVDPPPVVPVTRVEVIGEHELRLAFADGIVGDIGFHDRKWRGVFEPLRDPRRFAQVCVDPGCGTIVWPEYGLDMAPEPLYEEALRHQVPHAPAGAVPRAGKARPVLRLPAPDPRTGKFTIDPCPVPAMGSEQGGVPKVSYFYGIAIKMYWDEGHHSRPHFHACYAEHEASLDLAGRIIAGSLPTQALRLVGSWAKLHHDELHANWRRVVNEESPVPIAPLF
jgi:Domain of unknown function (DUF4160)/Protein of unknown function (DUF2442)